MRSSSVAPGSSVGIWFESCWITTTNSRSSIVADTRTPSRMRTGSITLRATGRTKRPSNRSPSQSIRISFSTSWPITRPKWPTRRASSTTWRPTCTCRVGPPTQRKRFPNGRTRPPSRTARRSRPRRIPPRPTATGKPKGTAKSPAPPNGASTRCRSGHRSSTGHTITQNGSITGFTAWQRTTGSLSPGTGRTSGSGLSLKTLQAVCERSQSGERPASGTTSATETPSLSTG